MHASLPTQAVFNGITIDLIHHAGQVWLTAEQIGLALGIQHARRAVLKIYQRHVDEFTAAETGVTKLVTPGGRQETRMFSPDGARLLAMFAQTDRAKTFRRWVLEVLKASIPASTLPAPVPAAPAAAITEAVTLTSAEYIRLLQSRVELLELRAAQSAPPRRGPISDAEVAEMQRLAARGISHRCIAQTITCSLYSVREHLRRARRAAESVSNLGEVR